jgi:hypothetical protein
MPWLFFSVGELARHGLNLMLDSAQLNGCSVVGTDRSRHSETAALPRIRTEPDRSSPHLFNGRTPHEKANMLGLMTLSARNRLEGKITELQLGGVMAHVVVQVGNNVIESVITR